MFYRYLKNPEPGPQFYPVSVIDYLTGYLMAFGAMVALARRAREGGSWLVRIPPGADGTLAGGSRRGTGNCPPGCSKRIPILTAGRSESTRPSGACVILVPPCAFPKLLRAGLDHQYRSAIASRSVPPAAYAVLANTRAGALRACWLARKAAMVT
jgi:hypothetical protein